MGLLSDPRTQEKLLGSLVKWRKSLSILGYIGGMVWIFLLATDEFSSKTPLSEHALLPGLVETRYSEDHMASDLFDELSKISVNDIVSQRQWIEDQLVTSGLEVFHQNFSCGNGMVEGRNIYGILRTSRSTGIESLVLNVPLKPACRSNGGIALMISVANYFKQLSFWDKDIIFLVTEKESCGTAAWLQAYHGEKSNGISSSELIGHGGDILAALVIDFPGDSISGIDVQPQGLNGRLPDLDLLYMVFIIAGSENIPVKLQTEHDYHQYQDPLEEYLRRVKTLTRMILLQASGYTTASHGIFLKYRIESITVTASEDGYFNHQSQFSEMGRFVEAMFRSFNNLLEHFHQSFFFYLLPTMERFLSISVYTRALGGVLLGPLVHSITLWIEVFVVNSENDIGGKPTTKKVTSFRWTIPILLVASHVSGVALFSSLSHLVQNQPQLFVDGKMSISLAVSSAIVAVTLRWFKPLRNEFDWKVLKFIVLFYLTLVIVTSAMLNFSLGFLLAISYVPISLAVGIYKYRLSQWLQCMLVILSSPMVISILFTGLHMALSRDTRHFFEDPIGSSLRKSDYFLKNAFTDDQQGVWTSYVVSYAVFPIWINLAVLSSPLET